MPRQRRVCQYLADSGEDVVEFRLIEIERTIARRRRPCLELAFVEAEKAGFPIVFTCHRLGVSTSGFCEWRRAQANPCRRRCEDAELVERILERRRRIDRALFAVVEAYVHGVSTRKVDDLVAALGAASGISKSEVSRICAGLDDEMATFRARPLSHVEFPYVYADATHLKRHVGGQVVSRAVVVATGVTATGEREVLGCAVGDTETETFWPSSSAPCAPAAWPVRLVVSEHHTGLRTAIGKIFIGAG